MGSYPSNFNDSNVFNAVSSTFNRPSGTLTYALGQMVANSGTATNVTPMEFSPVPLTSRNGSIRRARIFTSGTSISYAQFRLHLYQEQPTCANGDGGAWDTDYSSYLGAFLITCDKVHTDGISGIGYPEVGSEINFETSQFYNIYGLLEARAAYDAASAETFFIYLEFTSN